MDSKFRAWDDDAEFMFYSDKTYDEYFFEFKDGKLMGFAIRPPKASSDPKEPPEPYCDKFPVEQYTGLKDKNGTEIYEGDKITVKDWTIEFEVAFDNGMFVLGNLSSHKSVYQGMQDYRVNGKVEMEVIGDIHTEEQQ